MAENESAKIPIRLKLVTEIRDGAGRKELLTIEEEGTLYSKEDATFLAYKEMMENVGQISNVIKVKGDEVLIMRSGGVSMRQTYKKGATTFGSYQSPYGMMEMVAKTENIDFTNRIDSRKAKLILSYQLQMQGEWVGRHRLTFMIEKIE
ncbi:DUF1934 domain-containing protein [Schinkia azotoformans]|uniref:DUF1934 domain-containing protein n=1 Tax=Schinkia azotoformans LMG 9581 TaxID=1131731 RepID=K6D4L6_SCHAZ|nr:DUF1934 domain-containing protein [Schinkia azotoformans]EKN62973.1 hypothetical protein BAZO_19473 [Schinkia azotoformans LMG 9581]MEC1639265.1 DUF1934 domain-containing protein [Schinkia azotoformans]MEC1719507.1 DUF1934 domain-containing protein [Schinkia azotoformans]MEC1945852.1 DUF1934 domain-containing protein [Schinkia azotoformans]MED4413761.1 DUF1934 domain-containing protein [Schinkia azotoformans]